MTQKTQGECIGCKKMYAGAHAGQHLLKCEDIKDFLDIQAPSGQGYMLKVACAHQPNIYWMFITVPANAKLSYLDSFLRTTWLECCGHLSAFAIQGISYCISTDMGERSMEKKVDKIFFPGLSFKYTYDFGSSTDLQMKVIDTVEACSSKEINVLMQNEAPVFKCEICKKDASRICSYCFETVCEKCMPSHECVKNEEDDSMMLLLVNSPRVGVCGYDGF